MAENYPLTSSFFNLLSDSWRKRHCSLNTGSLQLIQTFQELMENASKTRRQWPNHLQHIFSGQYGSAWSLLLHFFQIVPKHALGKEQSFTILPCLLHTSNSCCLCCCYCVSAQHSYVEVQNMTERCRLFTCPSRAGIVLK